MDRSAFEAGLLHLFYAIVARAPEPNITNREHGARSVDRFGETMEIGHRHGEIAGPDSPTCLAGHRTPG
jgi:hypothetical protein